MTLTDTWARSHGKCIDALVPYPRLTFQTLKQKTFQSYLYVLFTLTPSQQH